MYVKSSNFVIYMGLALVVGFALSFFTGNLGVESGLTGGDISKAARYSNQKEDPSFTVIEEKLRNDEEFFNNTKGAMAFLQNRMEVLSALSEETMAACEGIPEFEPLMDELKSIGAKSFNTATAMENAGKSLDKIAAGQKAPEYEVYSNMAFIGFSKVEANIDFGKKFLEEANVFLQGKDAGKYGRIAELANVWTIYCAQDDYLNGREQLAMEAPGNADSFTLQGAMSSNSVLDAYLNSLSSTVESLKASDNSLLLKNVAVEQLNSIPAIYGLYNSAARDQLKNSVNQLMGFSITLEAFPSETITMRPAVALNPREVEVD